MDYLQTLNCSTAHWPVWRFKPPAGPRNKQCVFAGRGRRTQPAFLKKAATPSVGLTVRSCHLQKLHAAAKSGAYKVS